MTTQPEPDSLHQRIAKVIDQLRDSGGIYAIDDPERDRIADAVLAVVQPVIDEARATNQRLNYRAQTAEARLNQVTVAVAEWQVDDRGTYVPMRTLNAIAKAVGIHHDTSRWELHYQHVEALEAALARVRDLVADMQGVTGARWWAEQLTTALTLPVSADDPEASSAGIDWRDIAAQREEARCAAVSEANRANAVLAAITALAFDADLRPDVRLSRIRNLIDPADGPEGGAQ